MLTKKLMQELKEEPLTKTVIMPILKQMGYQGVRYHGGSSEQGKDVVCWLLNALGIRRNLALVVKAVPITGRAAKGEGNAGEVQAQIQQCFNAPFLDADTAEAEIVHECWVVTSRSISSEALESLNSMLSDRGWYRNVTYIDGDRLWMYAERYLSLRTVWQKIQDAAGCRSGFRQTCGKCDTLRVSTNLGRQAAIARRVSP